MQSGGLAPPPPGSGPPPPAPAYPGYPNATQRRLEEAAREDSGRGLEFVYFDVGGGAQLAGLTAMSESGRLLPGTATNSAIGPYVSAAAGIRLLFLTAGPRFRFARFSDWDLWTLNLDLGWRIPLGNLEPYAVLGGGFAKVGRSAERVAGIGDVSISGFDVRIGSGLDYYVSNALSVGASVELDMLCLSRGGTTVAVPTDPAMTAAPESFARDASSVGIVLTAGAVVGLHF
jgi:hypothetical protein